MALSIGIVGLPNVGKSTLFNAITNASVDAQNYPFCTIEPNKGIVPVPDNRLDELAKISTSEKIIHATIEFVDIAGLVKGASKGEGLGNKFLSTIRESNAIIQVIRCFEDDNVVHVHGGIDPIDDIEVIELELLLTDLDMTQKLVESQAKKARGSQKEEIARLDVLKKIEGHLSENKPVRQLDFSEKETDLIKGLFFLSDKPTIYVANVSEDMVGNMDAKPIKDLAEYAKKSNSEMIVISAKLEEELSALDAEEKVDYLKELGLDESGLDQLARASYTLLGLQTYLTTGPKETRAWTIKKGWTGPQAAGVIHTDFEKGFIRANVLGYDNFIDCGGWKVAKDKGLLRQEGKDYIMQEGDVVEFLFNV